MMLDCWSYQTEPMACVCGAGGMYKEAGWRRVDCLYGYGEEHCHYRVTHTHSPFTCPLVGLGIRGTGIMLHSGSR